MSRRTRSGRNDWLGVLFTVAVGLVVIVSGGWNYVTVLFGSALCAGSLLEIREIRLMVEVRLNRISGRDIFQIQDSKVSNSNVIGNIHGDVYINNPPVTTALPKTAQEISREFSIGEDEYEAIPIQLNKSQRLEGVVSADGEVSVYIMSRASLRSFEDDEDFNPYERIEGVRRSNVSYTADRTKTVYLVIERDEDSSDDDVNVEIDLQILE